MNLLSESEIIMLARKYGVGEIKLVMKSQIFYFKVDDISDFCLYLVFFDSHINISFG